MKIKGVDWREITSSSKSKKVVNMARHFNHRQNKRSAHYKAHLYRMKVYNIRRVGPHQSIEGLLIKILLFFPTEVFTCSKVINAFKRSSLWTDLLQRSSTSLL